ncbi:MAG TPA: SGNH/GDSL hydrolase family protein [Acidobacteriaceae bacterium]|nr:SGNH/GDSL hydrolase family protein [Acidobacteriaceae bacterium]
MKSAAILCVSLLCALPLAAQTAPCPADAAAQCRQIAHMQTQLDDWAQLDRYHTDNAALLPPAPNEHRVVFMGDSITDAWGHGADFFPGKPYLNRGISGQTTPQMLVRFQPDVVHLQPSVVVILAGTNDIAGNTGPSTPQMIEDNFVSMADIAHRSGIKVVIASILPAIAYPWRPGIKPADEIRTLNTWLKDFCKRDGDVYLDYYSHLTDAEGGMAPGLSKDGVHPTPKGYAIMAPLAEEAIAEALQK